METYHLMNYQAGIQNFDILPMQSRANSTDNQYMSLQPIIQLPKLPHEIPENTI